MRPIDADALIRRWCGIKCGCERSECGRETEPCIVVMGIEEAPTIEPERKRGKWIDTGSGQECSECHEFQPGYDGFRFFCACCGADMREGEQDG